MQADMGSLNDALLGFVEDAIRMLFATRCKPMQPSERQFFLKLDDALGELTVGRLKRGDLHHQFRNIGNAGWIHRIFESETASLRQLASMPNSPDIFILPTRAPFEYRIMTALKAS